VCSVTEELWRLSAGNAEKKYRAGTLRPSEVLASVLERLDDVNGKINAFAIVDRDGAIKAAGESDRRWDVGRPLGPLDGSVVTIKDNITVKGLPCAWGSELFRDFVPDKDELPAQRLREAGCVVLGKTTVSEFTTAQTNVSTKAFGTTRNPWNLNLTTGASSGGACAALASGVGQIALATDGGGSIRRPASHCGLVGLKPSVGRVARLNGLPVILHDCEVVGPIARDAFDLGVAFDTIAKPHPEDRASFAFGDPPVRYARPLRRIFYTPCLEGHDVDPEVDEACARAVEDFAKLGYEVQTGSAPFDFALYEKHWPAIRDAGLAWLMRERAWKGRIGDVHASLVAQGEKVTGADYVDALTAFREVQASFGRFFKRFDLFMTPTAGTLPWPAEQQGPPRNRVFTGIVNAAGNPAISIPAARAGGDLPVGFQLVGPFGSDDALIDIAQLYQRHHSWLDRWPKL
jgi:aspartyl-tRNA(Asn)/glutamyl-tRNA(Gln) amidotransferase subunit A